MGSQSAPETVGIEPEASRLPIWIRLKGPFPKGRMALVCVDIDQDAPSRPVLRTTLEGHTDWTSGLDFDPAGQRLATSGKDGLAIVWDVASSREILRLQGHDQWVNRVAFSNDGKLIATGGDDALAIVWDAKTGKPKLRLRASTGVTALAFTADDRALAITDRNTVFLYPLDFSYADRDPAALLEESQLAAGLRLDGFRLSIAKPTQDEKDTHDGAR